MATVVSDHYPIGTYTYGYVSVDYSGTSATAYLHYVRTNTWSGEEHDTTNWSFTFGGSTTYSHDKTSVSGQADNVVAHVGFSISLNGGTYSGSSSSTIFRFSGSVTIPAQATPAPITGFTGNNLEGNFSATYTSTGSYTYKLRISIPNVQTLMTFNYPTSGAAFALDSGSLTYIRNYMTQHSTNQVTLGAVIETWNGSTKVGESSELTNVCKFPDPIPVIATSTSATPSTLTLTVLLSSVTSTSNLPVSLNMALYSDSAHTQVISTSSNTIYNVGGHVDWTVSGLSPATTYYFTTTYSGSGTYTGFDGISGTTGLYPAPVPSFTVVPSDTGILFDSFMLTGGNPNVHTASFTADMYSDSSYTTLVDTVSMSSIFIGDLYPVSFGGLSPSTTYYYKITVSSSGCSTDISYGNATTLGAKRLKTYDDTFVKNTANIVMESTASDFDWQPDLCCEVDFQYLGDLTGSGTYKHLVSAVKGGTGNTSLLNICIYDTTTPQLNVGYPLGGSIVGTFNDPYKRHIVKWEKDETKNKMVLYCDDTIVTESIIDDSSAMTVKLAFFNKSGTNQLTRAAIAKIYRATYYTINNGIKTIVYNYLPDDTGGIVSMKDTVTGTTVAPTTGNITYSVAGPKEYPVMLSQNGGTFIDVSRSVKISTNGGNFQ